MADLILIRHAIALEREEWQQSGSPDYLRPLSDRGIRKFKKSLAGLLELIPSIDLIYSSDFTRAKETAQLLGSAYDRPYIVKQELNHGEAPRSILEYLSSELEPLGYKKLAIVGHEPELCILLHLISGRALEDVYFKKGGVAYLSQEHGKLELKWMKRPKELRAIETS